MKKSTKVQRQHAQSQYKTWELRYWFYCEMGRPEVVVFGGVTANEALREALEYLKVIADAPEKVRFSTVALIDMTSPPGKSKGYFLRDWYRNRRILKVSDPRKCFSPYSQDRY